MAISLERVQNSKLKRTAAKPKGKSASRRPWQGTQNSSASLANVDDAPTASWLDSWDDDISILPAEFESASTHQLLTILAKHALEKRFFSLKQKSYLMARLTHKESWLARVKLFPKLQIPLPAWMTHK